MGNELAEAIYDKILNSNSVLFEVRHHGDTKSIVVPIIADAIKEYEDRKREEEKPFKKQLVDSLRDHANWLKNQESRDRKIAEVYRVACDLYYESGASERYWDEH